MLLSGYINSEHFSSVDSEQSSRCVCVCVFCRWLVNMQRCVAHACAVLQRVAWTRECVDQALWYVVLFAISQDTRCPET